MRARLERRYFGIAIADKILLGRQLLLERADLGRKTGFELPYRGIVCLESLLLRLELLLEQARCRRSFCRADFCQLLGKRGDLCFKRFDFVAAASERLFLFAELAFERLDPLCRNAVPISRPAASFDSR